MAANAEKKGEDMLKGEGKGEGEGKGKGKGKVKGKGEGNGSKPDIPLEAFAMPVEEETQGNLDLRWIEEAIAETHAFRSYDRVVDWDMLKAMVDWELRRRRWHLADLMHDED